MEKSSKKNKSKNTGKSPKEKEKENKKEEPKRVTASTQANEKDKSNNKKGEGKDNKDTKDDKKNLAKYKLDFIYRREKYTLNKLLENSLVSLIKRKIGEMIKVDPKLLKFYYKEKELGEDSNKDNVYNMIKGDNAPFIDVKKGVPNNQEIISLNTTNLIYKVSCKPIPDYSDFVDKINQFFKDICLENNSLCEPTSTNSYVVCFSCSDHCFQFKRYMMNISRTNEMYKKSKFDVLKVDKSKIIEPKIERNEEEEVDENTNKIEKMVVVNKKNNKEVEIEYRKMKHRENDYFQKDFLNNGPYNAIEEIKKKEEKDNKKKWISKKNFSAL